MPPVNDNFAAAIELVGNSGFVVTDNTGASKETGEPHTGGTSKTLWYKWTAPADCAVRFNTYGSATDDTVLGVYTGAAVNALSEIAFNDDCPTSTWSEVLCDVTSGVTYFIQIDGFGGTEGGLRLNWKAVLNDLVLPYDWPMKHPNAIYGHAFGQDYPGVTGEADWRAALQHGVLDVNTGMQITETETGGGGHFSSDHLLNCAACLRVIDGNVVELLASTNTRYPRSYNKLIVWMDSSVPILGHAGGFADIAGLGGNASVSWGYQTNDLLADNPVALMNASEFLEISGLAGEVAVPEAYTSVSGRWFVLIGLGEDDGISAQRLRVFAAPLGTLVATKIYDATGATSGDPVGWDQFVATLQPFVNATTPYDPMAPNPSGLYYLDTGLFEIMDGGTTGRPVNPYAGLEGISAVVSGSLPSNPCLSKPQFWPQVI